MKNLHLNALLSDKTMHLHRIICIWTTHLLDYQQWIQSCSLKGEINIYVVCSIRLSSSNARLCYSTLIAPLWAHFIKLSVHLPNISVFYVFHYLLNFHRITPVEEKRGKKTGASDVARRHLAKAQRSLWAPSEPCLIRSPRPEESP